MQASINSYTPDIPVRNIQTRTREHKAVAQIQVEVLPKSHGTIKIKGGLGQHSQLNKPAFNNFYNICGLQDDWDGEESPAPSNNVMQSAFALINILDLATQQIYNVVPGPRGEIMVDVRGKNSKSVEFIIYPDKIKYVKFSEIEAPEQGLFNNELISGLLTWVNQ